MRIGRLSSSNRGTVVVRLAALVSVLAVLAFPSLAHGVTLTVTTTADGSGPCSPTLCTLRSAIEASNSLFGQDVIAFNIPGSPPYTLSWGPSSLPAMTDPVKIDGTTQPGYAGTPVVRLDRGPNLASGLYMYGGGLTVLGLDIRNPGLVIYGDGNTIGQPGNGNTVNVSAQGAYGVSISGGSSVIQDNQISSNSGYALWVHGSDNTIGGSAANAGNGLQGTYGLYLWGDRNSFKSNSISRGGAAIEEGRSNLIQGNSIDGDLGIAVSGDLNNVLANTITLLNGPGVRIKSGTGNRIRSNIIPDGIGILLGNGTSIPNDQSDADTGANNLQNYPVLRYAQSGASTTTVVGTLNSEPNKHYDLEFFTSHFSDFTTPCGGASTGSEQGGAERVLGTYAVNTDANGDASFTATLPTTIPAGDWVTATATDPGGNTSAFAKCKREGLADLSVTKTDSPDPVSVGQNLTYHLSVHNAGPENVGPVLVEDELPSDPLVSFVQATSSDASCSQDNGIVRCTIDTLNAGSSAGIDVVVRPLQGGLLTNHVSLTAIASPGDPDETDNSDVESTSVLNPNGYARPLSATPAAIRLVPAFKACAAPNSAHGAPLAAPSCNPPVQTSDYLTVGTPDLNGQSASSNGYLGLRVVGEQPVNVNNGDQADIEIWFRYSDVRRKSDLLDYTGELRVVLNLRITDRYNGGSLTLPATASDVTFPITVACRPTGFPSNTSLGSNCDALLTADSAMPGSIVEGKRTIWELGQVQVFDGGADGRASTTGDNTLFAVQGTFAP